jgi:tRNA(Met) C34 N-acetyltransferase TmcA
MEQLRRQSELNENEGKGKGTGTQHRRLFELSLEESIRYGNDDPVI